jgi:hypothetical protein
MADAFLKDVPDLESPGIGAFEITPSDSTVFDQPTRALWVGTQGNLKVQLVGGSVVTFKNMIGLLPVRVNKVFSTGNTAADIVGVF